jgi:long-chain acyl-CoA synthetase
VQYLLDDPGACGVILENAKLLERVLAVEDDLELDFIVSMDELEGTSVADSYEDREDIYTLADVHELGAREYEPEAYEMWLDEREPSDLCSLIYTSGTTGRPKGVKLTHRNFRSNVNQVYARFGPRADKAGSVPAIDNTDVTLSYLPLAHVFERTSGHFMIFGAGACVSYAEHPDTLREDFQLVEPTTATSVPRVYEKIYDSIREQATESNLKERIFNWATDVGREYHETEDPGVGLQAKYRIADRLVFSTVKEGLGGNIKFLFSGGGSLSPELCSLYHGMGIPVLEGYGLTETAPVVTTNPAEEPKIGTIGYPVVQTETKVDDSVVGEDEFQDCEGEVGELLVQGPQVMEGYWNKPGETAETFLEDEDGKWLRTGDIVHLRPDGYIAFKDRAKQLIVLSTGKNVAPGPIEDAFSASEVVEQCMVVGDGRKFIGALIVPNIDTIVSRAEEESIELPEEVDEIADTPWARDQIQTEVDRVNERFEDYERIKQFELVTMEFTEDNGLLTPTMKKKRRNILSEFESEFEAIYEKARDPGEDTSERSVAAGDD